MKSIFLVFLCSLQFLSANAKVLTLIPEASGITYVKKTNTLFVVNDEGILYELNLKGKILRKKHLGSFDLEGISFDSKNDLLILAIEGRDNILLVHRNNFHIKKEISIKRKYKNKLLLKKDKKRGLEGIVLIDSYVYISNQSNIAYPKEDASVIVILPYTIKKKKLKIIRILDHGLKDISGLTYYRGDLYLVSDKKSTIYQYSFKVKRIIKKKKLNKSHAQEGITFDKKGNLYIADDKGKILVYKNFKM